MLRSSTIKRSLVLSTVIAAFLLLLVALPASARKGLVDGNVMRVKDGDTVVIAPAEGGEFFTCRLYGIDAPEISHGRQPGQSYGEEATKELKKLILGQPIKVELMGSHSYGREICIIRKDGQDVNLEMVKRGYAWAYREYLKRAYASEYIDAERTARSKKLGLWQQANPLPPWEFRRALKHNGR